MWCLFSDARDITCASSIVKKVRSLELQCASEKTLALTWTPLILYGILLLTQNDDPTSAKTSCNAVLGLHGIQALKLHALTTIFNGTVGVGYEACSLTDDGKLWVGCSVHDLFYSIQWFRLQPPKRVSVSFVHTSSLVYTFDSFIDCKEQPVADTSFDSDSMASSAVGKHLVTENRFITMRISSTWFTGWY